MNKVILCTAGNSPALEYARENLINRGISVVDIPAPDITHLLLPVPSFEADGRIRGGGILQHILADLPETVTVIGGNLQTPALAGYKTLDLLSDETYIAQNAAITADCALRVAAQQLPAVFSQCPILVVGWGRIGKCLAKLLQAVGARVAVAARKSADRATLCALGFATEDAAKLGPGLAKYRVIFNTAPAVVINEEQAKYCSSDCIKIDLASRPGILGNRVISARGLPGKMVPETSGILIAKTVIRLLGGKGA